MEEPLSLVTSATSFASDLLRSLKKRFKFDSFKQNTEARKKTSQHLPQKRSTEAKPSTSRTMSKIHRNLFLVSFVALVFVLAVVDHRVKGLPLPRVGPSSNPKPVPQEMIDRINSLYDEMDCRWRSLGCTSTDGPFAVTYLHMTRIVKEGIENMYFDDGALMVNFTINFANRYLEAIDKARRCNETPSLPWAEAFDYGDSLKSSVMEDAFIGINAHIVSRLIVFVSQRLSKL